MTDTATDLAEVVAPTESLDNKGAGTVADSIKALRAQRDEARAEIEWLRKDREQRMVQQRPVQPQEEPEDDFDYRTLEQEQFPEGKNLARAFSKFDKKFSKYEQKLIEKDRKIAVLETAMQHKDFNDIVTPENIKKYIESDEDNLESVRKADNPGLKCYNLIRKSAAYQNDIQAKKAPVQEQKRIEEKDNKPRTSSVGVRSEGVSVAAAISNSKMSKEQKAALWSETKSLARR